MDATALTARVQHIWDGAQPAYSVLVDDRVQAPANVEFIAAIRARLAGSGVPESGLLQILDLAGGTGHPSLAIAEALPDAHITLTDLSPNMVDFATTRVAERGLSDRIRTQQADAQSLTSLKDAAFDVVTCMYGLFMMPDHTAALREAARVVCPGGLLAFCVWGPDEKCQLAQLFTEAVRQLPIEAPPPPARRDRMADIGWTKSQVEAAGFVHAQAKVFEHVQECKVDALVAMMCHMVLKGALQQAGADGDPPPPDAGPTACMAALEALGCSPHNGVVTLHNEALLYTGVKPLNRPT